MRRRLRELFPLFFLLPLAAAVLYRGPFSASNLEVEPDSIEYAVGAERLASLGRYDIVLEGKTYPPRYPPWFSLLLYPAYKLGHDLGDGIYVVLGFALLGVAAAWSIGSSIAGPWGGLLAGLSPLAIPEYRHLSELIMTDVPACALTLCGCALFLAPPAEPVFLAAGCIAGLAVALRPLLAGILLPFALAAVRGTRPLRKLLWLCAPAAGVALLTALYNARTFGSPWRGGYNFWCPIPYDFTGLVFSFSYAADNLRVTFGLSAFLILAVLLLGWRTRRSEGEAFQNVSKAAVFSLLGIGGLLLAHLLYFGATSRYALPVDTLAAALAGSLAALWLRPFPEKYGLAALAFLIFAVALARASTAPRPPVRRLRADMMARRTPDDALIVTDLNLAYLEPLALRGTRRRALPFGRSVEYADKVVAWKTVAGSAPRPSSPFDQENAALLAAGAQEAVPFVASERLGALAAEIARGTPVFMDTAYLPPDDAAVAAELAKRFRLQAVGPAFYRLLPR